MNIIEGTIQVPRQWTNAATNKIMENLQPALFVASCECFFNDEKVQDIEDNKKMAMLMALIEYGGSALLVNKQFEKKIEIVVDKLDEYLTTFHDEDIEKQVDLYLDLSNMVDDLKDEYIKSTFKPLPIAAMITPAKYLKDNYKVKTKGDLRICLALQSQRDVKASFEPQPGYTKDGIPALNVNVYYMYTQARLALSKTPEFIYAIQDELETQLGKGLSVAIEHELAHFIQYHYIGSTNTDKIQDLQDTMKKSGKGIDDVYYNNKTEFEAHQVNTVREYLRKYGKPKSIKDLNDRFASFSKDNYSLKKVTPSQRNKAIKNIYASLVSQIEDDAGINKLLDALK